MSRARSEPAVAAVHHILPVAVLADGTVLQSCASGAWANLDPNAKETWS